MGAFEGEGLFPAPARLSGAENERATVRDDAAELIYSQTMERAARHLGQRSLFELGPGGMYVTQELF